MCPGQKGQDSQTGIPKNPSSRLSTFNFFAWTFMRDDTHMTKNTFCHKAELVY